MDSIGNSGALPGVPRSEGTTSLQRAQLMRTLNPVIAVADNTRVHLNVPRMGTALQQVDFGSATDPQPPAPAQAPSITVAELARLGRASDKAAFFRALAPGAVQAEKEHGVPASVTLVQAALESGWGRHDIGGNNLFGIKGEGNAGTIRVPTTEYVGGQRRRVNANFARYHTVQDAVAAHGRLFNNGNYDKAMARFAETRDPYEFVRNIARKYATAPNYADTLIGMMRRHNLVEIAREFGGT